MLYFIRHAESQFNVVREKMKVKYSSSDYHLEPEWLFERFNLDHMDSELSETGKKQAEQCRQKMKNENIDLVLVSPLRRTLQTCDIIFRNHKSKPKIIVDPVLRQCFESTCDIGGRMIQSMQEFDYFDFSLIQDPQVWYIHHIFDEQIKQRLLKRLENLQGEERYKIGLQLSIEFLKEIHQIVVDDREYLVIMHDPMLKQRDYIKQKYMDANKNIAVVSHSQNLKVYFNKGFLNCEVMSIPQDQF